MIDSAHEAHTASSPEEIRKLIFKQDPRTEENKEVRAGKCGDEWGWYGEIASSRRWAFVEACGEQHSEKLQQAARDGRIRLVKYLDESGKLVMLAIQSD